jgi:hypothetical protein
MDGLSRSIFRRFHSMSRAFNLTAFPAFLAVLLSVSAASAAPACKDGATATITGQVTIQAAATDQGGDWMLVGATLDPANKCTVMDLFGKGQAPKNCSQDKHFKATGTARDKGYALDVKEISCF